MAYNKYCSIENHYNTKIVSRIIGKCPELLDMKFELTEKIDGSNFQVMITKEYIKYGKRNSELSEGEGFFDYQTVVGKEQYQDLFKKIQAVVHEEDEVRLYGELFGPGVQRRIQYGKQRSILFFDVVSFNKYLDPDDVVQMFEWLGHSDLLVPRIAVVDSLQEALDYESEIPTQLFEAHPGTDRTEPQNIEGIVIKPMSVTYSQDKRVIFKKKNESYKEISKEKHSKKHLPKEQTELEREFLTYLTESRMCSVVSKFGGPEDAKDIGKYISIFGEDAMKEFKEIKDFVSKSEEKQLKRLVGAVAVPLIKAYL